MSKELARVRNARYFQKHKERLQKQRTDFYRNNPIHQMCRNAKTNAKQKGLPYDLQASLIPVPEVCPVLGIPLKVSHEKLSMNSPSLDRIRPELGYVMNNVRVISHRANMLKNNMTIGEAELILQDLKAIQN